MNPSVRAGALYLAPTGMKNQSHYNHRTAVTEIQPAIGISCTGEIDTSASTLPDIDISLKRRPWEPFASLCCLVLVVIVFMGYSEAWSGRRSYPPLRRFLEQTAYPWLGISMGSVPWEAKMFFEETAAYTCIAFGFGFGLSGMRRARSGFCHYLAFAGMLANGFLISILFLRGL